MSVSILLKRVQLFANLNKSELDQVAAICTKRQVARDDLILEQNTTGTEMYIVAEGTVDVFIKTGSERHSLVMLGKGQVIGEMALIDQGYRSASVRATRSGATLYLIESDKFYELCATNNHIGFVVMRNLAIDIAFKLRHRNLDVT